MIEKESTEKRCPEDKNPQEELWDALDCKRKANRANQIEFDNRKILSEGSNTDLTEISVLFKEIPGIFDVYNETYKNLKEERDCLTDYYRARKEEIEKEIKDEKIRRKIENMKGGIEGEIKDLKDCIDKLQGTVDCPDCGYKCPEDQPVVIVDCKGVYCEEEDGDNGKVKACSLKKAEFELECSNIYQIKKQKEYDELKGYKEKVEGEHKKVKELQKKIAGESNSKKKYKKYFYILELRDILIKVEKCEEKDNEILEPEVLKQQWYDKLDELKCAKRSWRIKTYIKNIVSDTLTAIRDGLKELEKNREENILQKIDLI
ncbi:MAG: hypothetical protein GY797_16025 [Deltaproteobacteria bacterium]|nr:hypothetical protein [Deltaproteobacteria bacterium]MCP5007180.1 hypothetical protein [Planctomycetota bacterium]